MMKKALLVLLGGVVIWSFSFAAAQAQPLKIGVVDLQVCIRDSIEGKQIFKELKGKKDRMQKKLDAKQEELLKLKEELDKQGMMLSMDAKEDREKEFERKRREFKYYYDDLSEDMRKAEAEARTGILKELEKVVDEVGKKRKLSLVFERRSGGIMYLDNALDITKEVIKAYDRTKK
jgi:outer membrane protein